MIAAAHLDADTDEVLIRRFQQSGDTAAFESLVHRYERDLFGYLRRYLHSAEMAEDVFQTTFLQVHLKRDAFADGRRFRPWLYAIATHQAIDAQRRNRRHRAVDLDRLVAVLDQRHRQALRREGGHQPLEQRGLAHAGVAGDPEDVHGAIVVRARRE